MCFLGYRFHVLFVKDLEGLRISESEDFLTKELDAEGVDGTDEVTCVICANKAVDAVAHLLGRLVGERKTKDIAGVYAKLVNKKRIPVCQHACLA